MRSGPSLSITPAAPPPSASSHGGAIGSLTVQVLKASGALFESGIRVYLRLSVAVLTQQSTARRHPLLDRRKPLVWEDEAYTFPIVSHTDGLSVVCHRDDGDVLGSSHIHLHHLPQGTNVVKWYELKLKDRSSAVVQLGLSYTLSYSLHHTQPSSAHSSAPSLTMHPSSQAREFIRQQLLDYARKSSTRYRFIDYFCVVGCADPQLSSSAHTNVPSILTRYPDEDHSDVALPDEVAMFSFPDGYALSIERQSPRLFSFRLNCDMDQMLVTCLLFWEQRPLAVSAADERKTGTGAGAGSDFILPGDEQMVRNHTQASVESASVLMHVPRALLFTSRLSYVAQHREILTQLYQHFFSPIPSPLCPSLPTIQLPCPYSAAAASPASSLSSPCLLSCPCTDPIRLDCVGQPFETYLTLLTQEVPLPKSGGTPVEVTVACRTYRLSLPASELDFPHLEFDLHELFQVLDVECVLMAMRCVLSEMKLIFYSSSRSLLHAVSESIIALCFPFTWSHVYVPVLPKSLLGIIEAPVSFIVGLHSATPPDLDHISDLTPYALIDIDRSSVDLAQPPPPFPAHAVRVLLKGLRRLIRPGVFKADNVREEGGVRGEAEIYQKLHSTCGGGRCSRVSAVAVTAARPASSPASPLDSALQLQEQSELAELQACAQRTRLIRHEFFAFLSSLLHGYREYLWFTMGVSPTFDASAFLTSAVASDHVPFLSRFLETQLFRDFLDRHVETPSFLQDYLTYIDCAPAPPSSKAAQPFVVPQRAARSLRQWATLIHPNLVNQAHASAPRASLTRAESATAASLSSARIAAARARVGSSSLTRGSSGSASVAPAHWSSLTNPVPVDAVVSEDGGTEDLPSESRPVGRSLSGAAERRTSTSYIESPALQSPIAFHHDRLASYSSNHLHAASFGESNVSPPRVRPTRVSTTVVSLAPAVTTFTSSQTVSILTAGAVPTWNGDSADAEPLPQPDLGPLPNNGCYRPWLMEPAREHRLDPTPADDAGVAESFVSAKNPSTLLHAPLPAMAIGADGKIEIVGGFQPPKSGAAKAPKAGKGGDRSASSSPPRQSILIEGQSEADFLTVAITSPKPARIQRSVSPSASPQPPVSPTHPSATAELSPASESSPTHRRSRSRHESFTVSALEGSGRPQSTTLMSKSELEMKKPPKDRRLLQLLATIFIKGATPGVEFDVAELSAVGELLALKKWRAMMVDLIGRVYGGFESRKALDGTERDRGLLVEAFSALLLLFNVALEECAVESDYVNAYALLQFSEKIYTSNSSARPPIPANTPSPPSTPHHADRMYLLRSLKKQPLWQSTPLWAFVYSAEVHRRRHAVFPSQACTLCAERHAGTAADPVPLLQELCLDVLCSLIGTQVSLGCPESMLCAFVEAVIKDNAELLGHQRPMLLQLISQAVRATTGMRGSASNSTVSSPRSAVLPMPTLRLRRDGEDGAARSLKADLSGLAAAGGGEEGGDAEQLAAAASAPQASPTSKYRHRSVREFRLDRDI